MNRSDSGVRRWSSQRRNQSLRDSRLDFRIFLVISRRSKVLQGLVRARTFAVARFSLPELFQVSARLFPRVKVCISGVLYIA